MIRLRKNDARVAPDFDVYFSKISSMVNMNSCSYLIIFN